MRPAGTSEAGTSEPAKTEIATNVVKRSLAVAGHRTSVSLEEEFWTALKDIAAKRTLSIAALVAEIDAARGAANLSSALRVYVLKSSRDLGQ